MRTIATRTGPLSLLAAALLLAGCANLAPAHQRPALPVADSFGPAALADGSATAPAASDLPWQQFYAGDARLQQLIALALANNRDLRVALLNVEQAHAQARVSEANRLPTVGAGFNASRQPGSDGQQTSSYQAGLQISAYELDLFGKLKNQSEAATARYLASVEGGRAARLALVAAVAAAHYSLQASEELSQLAERTADAREESLRLVRLRTEAGASSALDLRSAESAAASARSSLAQARRQRAQDASSLALLLGQALPAALPATPALATLSLPAVPAGLPSAVLVKRPDVLQAEALLQAASASIGAARAAFFPSISLTTSVGTASSQLSDLFSNSVWSFAGQALMPIFDAGRNQANLASARAAQGIALAQYEKTVQTAFKEVADALVGRATLDEQLQAQQLLDRAEAERLRLTELRHSNGAANSLELLDAQRSSYAARQVLVQTQLARALNSVQLYKALGGGAAEVQAASS